MERKMFRRRRMNLDKRTFWKKKLTKRRWSRLKSNLRRISEVIRIVH